MIEIFLAALRLGLTSFGGPMAHIGYFREEYVRRRGWLQESEFAELLTLCQLLPGPASSQLGMGIGAMRGGVGGALAALLGFTLPSAVLMILFAVFVSHPLWKDEWVHGLKLVALAVVAEAATSMARNLLKRSIHWVIMIAAALTLLTVSGALVPLGAIVISGLIGLCLRPKKTQMRAWPAVLSRRMGAMHLLVLALLLLFFPLLAHFTDSREWMLADVFLRAGSFVFGGGHVVLPLLERELVPGVMAGDQFLAGYSVAQALPGPLFSFAAFAGMSAGGLFSALICLAAIFLPAYLWILGVMPFWQTLRANPRIQNALTTANACVVGVLAAAVYNPLWTSAVFSIVDAVIALGLFLLALIRTPPWFIVTAGFLAGLLF